MIKIISICTPTFNRKHTLKRLYNSLLHQKVKNFEWVIIDDGSTDGTKELIDELINEDLIPIKYFYQKNQGKHIALNRGIKISTHPLFTCLDSDDWFTEDATQKIEEYADFIMDNEKIAGIIFLDKFSDNTIIGTELPDKQVINWINLRHTLKIKGDKCFIFKRNIISDYPFPNFDDNNHMPPSYQLYLISEHYKMFCVNKAIKYVEYMPDGISHNIIKKYFSAPDNYTFYRKSIHKLLPTTLSKLRNSIHYNITNQLSKSHMELRVTDFSQRIINLITFPFSWIILRYLKLRKDGES